MKAKFNFKKIFSGQNPSRKESVTTKSPQEYSVKVLNETTSILAADLVVCGSIETSSNLTLKGRVDGDVSSKGELVVTGHVTGKITCEKSVRIIEATINGDIECVGMIWVRPGSVINGNIVSAGTDVSGTITGNIRSTQTVVLHSDCSIKGDVQASAISIDEGAVIDGKINIIRN